MRTFTRLALIFLALFWSNSAHADEYARFLLPVFTTPQPGAYGSLWIVDPWIHYYGDSTSVLVAPRPTPPCAGVCIEPRPFGVLFAGDAPLQYPIGPASPAGILVYVTKEEQAHFAFALRVRNANSATDDGTSVPVVSEVAFRSDRLWLLNVPVNSGARTALRLYALPETPEPGATLRYYKAGTSAFYEPVHEEHVTLERATRTFDGIALLPSFAMLQIQPSELDGVTAVHIEVVPDGGSSVWAMASITNNTTQHVTIVSPEP